MVRQPIFDMRRYWKKWACTVGSRDETYYEQKMVERKDTTSFTPGYISYAFDSANGKFKTSGTYITQSNFPKVSGATMPLYTTESNNTVLNSILWTYRSTSPQYSGIATKYEADGPYTRIVQYIGNIGTYMGNIYVPDGEYPEADKGYTYIAQCEYEGAEYTVMKYGTEYYAYRFEA